MIYLDYNATAPMRTESFTKMQEVLQAPRNASSIHGLGRQGRSYVNTARQSVAKLCGVAENSVVFNSGATEGNNTVLKHFAQKYPQERILISAIEHLSVLDALPNTDRIPVDQNGIIDLNALEDMLHDGGKVSLVSVMWVNNETGAIQPIKEIAALAHRYGAFFHCDGVQAAGRIPMNMAQAGIDFLTLSAHKIGGAQGVGALIFGGCGETPTLMHGGGQEKKARAGTYNVAGIAGLGIAADIALQELPIIEARTGRDDFEKELMEITTDIQIFGRDVPRVYNTSLFSISGFKSESILMALDLAGIAVSNGSACSSGSVQPSHVLAAMGVDQERANGAVRVSTGWRTSAADISAVLKALKKIVAR